MVKEFLSNNCDIGNETHEGLCCVNSLSRRGADVPPGWPAEGRTSDPDGHLGASVADRQASDAHHAARHGAAGGLCGAAGAVDQRHGRLPRWRLLLQGSVDLRHRLAAPRRRPPLCVVSLEKRHLHQRRVKVRDHSVVCVRERECEKDFF